MQTALALSTHNLMPVTQRPDVILLTHLNRDALPSALIALDGVELLGTASLRVNDMDILTELAPWLGRVYVPKIHRQKGIAPQLVNAVEQKALALGYRSLYLIYL